MKRDPIEKSDAYKKAMEIIQPELDKVPDSVSAKAFWEYKQKLLLEQGVSWKTPVEMNPDIKID